MSYFRNISEALSTTFKGFGITIKHLTRLFQKRTNDHVSEKSYFQMEEGIMTLQYPKETFKVPDNGRYKLHNEIDDCIVCDKCAHICPVDCIEIESIRSPEPYGKTSDGTPKKIHAAKFDIDMGKCCFCGLCTTVCPTECLTMTPEYDYSVEDISNHIFSFANMTPEQIVEKTKEWEAFEKSKQDKPSESSYGEVKKSANPRPVMKPKFKK